MTLLWLAIGADPAAAHSVSRLGANNYQTRLLSVTPEVPGIRVRVVETGSRIELTNTTNHDVIVLGYQEEPYLRVGPNGVFENRRSPAVYLNASRRADATIPGTADAEAEPDWVKTSDGNVARWHDHRIHWMGSQDPPAVRRDPARTHVVIPKWTITMRWGEQTITARGDLLWVPGPSPLPWLGLAAALLAAVTALAFTRIWARALAIVLAVGVAADFAHAVGSGWVKAGGVGAKIGEIASGSLYSIPGWIAGIVGVSMLARRRPDGILAAGFAGAFIALFGGIIDFTYLSRSQIPFVWSARLARLLVASSLGAGIGLVVAAFVGVRRHPMPRVQPAKDEHLT